MDTTQQENSRQDDGTFAKGHSGNPGGRRKKRWTEAIKRALSTNPTGEPNLELIEAVSTALVIAAKNGDMQAIKEIGDRLDGKPPQAHIGSDDPDDPPIRHTIAADTDIIARYASQQPEKK